MLFTVSSEGIYSTTIFTLVFPFLVVYNSTLLHFYLLTLDISYFADYKVLVPK